MRALSDTLGTICFSYHDDDMTVNLSKFIEMNTCKKVNVFACNLYLKNTSKN